MATVLLTVRATITPDQEAAFNRWYENEHCPQLLRYKGAVSARRYRKILGDDKYQYMAMYEFESEATFEAFQKSDHFAGLIHEYDINFGDDSERERQAYVQIWP
jgi:antibiotic biosynthesis monooxygenase (ABM) superfamily enzyme